MMTRRRVARLNRRRQSPEVAIRGRHQGQEGPLAAGGGEASETDSVKKRSGSEGEGDDGRCCRQSGGSSGDEEKASGDRQKAAGLGMPDGGVDGKD